MADTLIIDPAGDNIRLMVQRAGLSPDRRVGDIDAASAGNRRSFIVAEYRVASLVFINATPAICRQIKAKFARGAQVPCAGSVWLNPSDSDIVICDGVYSDDMEQGGPWRVPGITLNEVGSAIPYLGGGNNIVMTNIVSGDDPGDGSILVAAPGGGPGECFFVGTDLVPPTCAPAAGVTTCAIVFSAAPERIFVTDPTTNAGTLTGRPLGLILTKGTEGGSAFTYQSSKLRVYLCRGGIEPADAVFGPIDSEYRAGSFFGGVAELPFPDAVIWPYEIGDRIRIEIWSRLALSPGATDPDSGWVLYRQTICTGGASGVIFDGDAFEV